MNYKKSTIGAPRMAEPVQLSIWCKIASCLGIAAVLAACVAEFYHTGSEAYAWAGLGVIAILGFFVMWYAPLYVTLDNDTLTVSRMIRQLRIDADQIESVKISTPTMAEKRICGSGGFFGYWGWFSQADTGKYFAYYGKASDTFLVTLRSGRKYMIGCRDAHLMAKALREVADTYRR